MEENKLTKKERRDLAKEEKRKKREKEEKMAKLRKLFVWVVAGSILLFVGIKTYDYVTSPSPEVAGNSIEVDEGDWVKGNPEAQVTLVEYGDFQCPACKNYYLLVKQLNEEFPEDLRIAFRHIPLVSIHKNAMEASYAAEAAGVQGRFWEMHDALFENQADWENERDPRDKFVSYAEKLELDVEQFKLDMDSDQVHERVNADMTSAGSLGVNSTPTFYLDGERIQPRSYEEFRSSIEDQIRGYSVE